MSRGTLFIVSTPLGNPTDVSFRALETLRTVDVIACEERKEALRFLRAHAIERDPNLLLEINEHSREDDVENVIALLREGKNVALVSDCGTPLIADPGNILVTEAIALDARIVPIPGATSIISALVVSGFMTRRFLFRGFLSAKREEREREARELVREHRTIVLLEAPYRVAQLLESLSQAMPERAAIVAENLTTRDEKIHRGTLNSLHEEFVRVPRKSECVIVISAVK